jgi:hypothetical protein
MDNLTSDDIALVAMEECNEIAIALSKMIRFGSGNFHPDDLSKTTNAALLSREVGDLLGCLDELPIDWSIVELRRKAKIAKVSDFMRREGREAHLGKFAGMK